MSEDQKSVGQTEDRQEIPQLTEEQKQNLTYEELLRLTYPERSEAEIQKMIRKEKRYTMIGRVQIILLAIIICIIIFFIVTK